MLSSDTECQATAGSAVARLQTSLRPLATSARLNPKVATRWGRQSVCVCARTRKIDEIQVRL